MKGDIKYVLRWGSILLVLLVGFAASEEMFIRMKRQVVVEETEEPVVTPVRKSKRVRTPASIIDQDSEESVPFAPQVSQAESTFFPEQEPTPKAETETETEEKESKEPVISGSFASAPSSIAAARSVSSTSSSSKGGSKAAAFAQTITNTAFRGVLGSTPSAPRVVTPVSTPTSGAAPGPAPAPAPTVILPSLSIADVTVTEGGVATFTVSLSQIPTSTVSFNWATADQTALNGTDYTSGSNSIVIVPPATSATFTVNTTADVLACEGDKLFNVNLSSITGATATDTMALATIEEDDLPSVSFSAATSSGSEAGAISVGVTLSSACVGQTLTYQISTTDGTAVSSGSGQDFNALTSQSFTIPSGSLTSTFSFTPINDTRDEDDQDLTFTISSVEMGLGAQTTHVLTLNDNDAAPTVALSSLVTVTEGNGTGTTNAVMNASLSVASEKTVTVDFATSDASSGFIATTASGDYDAETGTLTFAPFDTTESLAVVINHDDLDENNERLNVTLSGGSNYTVAGSTLSSQFEITNDDSSPSLSIGTPVTIGEGGTNATFTITLSGVSGRTVGFDLATANGTATSGSDYTALSSSYTIAAGSLTRTVTVPITDDGLGCEGDETFTATLSNLSNAAAGTLVSTATITENDFPVVSISSATVNEGASASLTASLSFLCATPVSFDWTTVPGTAQMATDFPVTSGSVTINAGSLTSAAFTVPTTQDAIPEVQENFFVTATNINGASSFLGSVGVVTVNDSDPGTLVVKVASGAGSACALSSAGDIKCWGANYSGRLGRSIAHRGDEPGEMGNSLAALNLGDDSGVPYSVVKIVRAGYHACAILSNQRVKCWGDGLWYGRLGLANADENMGDHANELGNNLPFVDLGTDGLGNHWQVVDIGVGDQSSCALLSNGQVKCWGAGRITGTNNYVGRYGGMGNALPFLDLGGTNQALQLSVGHRHACVLLDDGLAPAGDGDVKCWGSNSYGELGNNSITETPIAPGGFGANLLPVNLGSGLKALSIATGNHMSCAIVEDNPATVGGFVKCWGFSGSGMLGLNSQENWGNGFIDSAPGTPVDEMGDNLPYTIIGAGQRATSIHAGAHTICAILDDDGDTSNGGNLKCWGDNGSNQTGNTVGNLWDHEGDEAGEMQALGMVNLGTGLKAFTVSLSEESTCVVVDNDNNVANGRGLKCWGRTVRGVLGAPHTAEADMILGNGGMMGDLIPFVDLGTGNVVDLSEGPGIVNGGYFNRNNHCAILSDGRAKCWGDDTAHQLLQGIHFIGDAAGEMGTNLPIVDLGTGVKAIDVAVGPGHACALTDTREVKCWGSAQEVGLGNAGWTGYDVGDDVGEMGNNLQSVNLGAGRTALSISSGYGGTCALLDNFQTKCWGNGGYYLGATYFGQATLPTPALDFGTGRYALQIDQQYDVGCALLDNLQVKCWGRNQFGQLMLDLTTSVMGTTATQDGDDLPYMNLGAGLNFIKISVDHESGCAQTTNGLLKCWGRNQYGRLASGQTDSGSFGLHLGDIASERGAGLPAVNLNGAQVVDFDFHNNGCAIVGASRELKCWGPHGWLRWGANGLGATLGAGDGYGDAAGEVGASFASVPIGVGRQAIQVTKSKDGNDTCVLLDDNSVKCFGLNNYGQAGLGSRDRIGDTDGEVAALTGIDLGF